MNRRGRRKVVATILPGYNGEDDIEKSLENVRKGMDHFPSINFVHFPVDDGSQDKTYGLIQHFCDVYQLTAFPHKNKENLGLVETLKQSYGRALEYNPDFLLKTDLDSDFNQETVFERMIPLLDTDFDVCAGVRWREIHEHENPYEAMRRKDLLKILDNHLNIRNMDPPSCGTQLYKASSIRPILNSKTIKNYDRRWGLDFLIPVTGSAMGKKVSVIQIENGSYDPERRPEEKVRSQYNAYIETVASFVRKRPKELSDLYDGECL